MSKLNGRLAELQLIADRGAEIVYADTGFVPPNRWLSNAVIRDFEERGLIQRNGNQASVTAKGRQALEKKNGN